MSHLTTVCSRDGFYALGPLPTGLKGRTHHLCVAKIQSPYRPFVNISSFLRRVKVLLHCPCHFCASRLKVFFEELIGASIANASASQRKTGFHALRAQAKIVLTMRLLNSIKYFT